MDNEVKKIENIDEFCKTSLSALMQVVRSSHNLPSAGDDYEFYSSFSDFREFISFQKEKIIKNVGLLMKNNGFKSITGQDIAAWNDVDDQFDRLIECNDEMLERVSALLDSCSGDGRQESAAIQHKGQDANEEVCKNSPRTIVSSWNRQDRNGKSKTFRLLHAHNILRPQLKFKDVIDNTATPFVTKLKTKPNALKPMSKALLDLHSDKTEGGKSSAPAITSLIRQARNLKEEDQSIYLHPYQYELDVWEPLPRQLEMVQPTKFTTFDENSCILVSTLSQLNDLLEVLKHVEEFALDLEAHTYRSFQGIVCLMQISTRDQDYIVDALALRSELHLLNEVLTDSKIVKVLHGANSDIVWLQRDFGLYIVNMFDTGQASRVLSLARNSLEFLAQTYCNVQFDKTFQLADWRVRPLPQEMLLYAQMDTHYLLYIYDVMKNQLLEKMGRNPPLLEQVWKRSRDICLLRYEKPVVTSESHLLLLQRRQRRGNLKQQIRSPQQLEALRLLYGWRDALARQEDESPGYVLPNHMLLQIAEILPREAQGVLACCNPIPPLLRQHVLSVYNLIKEARSVSSSTPQSVANNAATHVAPPHAKLEIDYDNLLHCPHDLSHSSMKKTFSKKSSSDIFPVAKRSSLLGPFDKDSQNDDVVRYVTSPSPASSLQRISTKVGHSPWNPFLLFFPDSIKKRKNENVDSEDEALTLEYMLSGRFPWKMCKLDVEEDAEDNEEESSKEFGTIVEIPDEAKRDTNQQIQVLQKMIKSSRKKSSNSSPLVRNPETSGLSQLSSPHQSFSSKSASKRSFTPHKYNEDDYKRFRKRGGKTKRFN